MKVSYVLRFLYFSKTAETIFSYRFPTVEELRYHPLRDSDCYCVNVYKIIDGEEISEDENGLNRFYFEGELILEGEPRFKRLQYYNASIKKYGAFIVIRNGSDVPYWAPGRLFNPKMDKRV